MQAGMTGEAGALLALGWAVEATMLRASAETLKANAREIRRVLSGSAIADDLDELSEVLALAAETPG